MALIYTADELIESIRNLTMVPDTGVTGCNDADILRHINEEMSMNLLPALLEEREDYLTVTTQVAVTAGTKKYRIPTRAMGDRLRNIQWLDSTTSTPEEMQEIGYLHQVDYSRSGTETPPHFYIEGNYICLVESVSGYLEVSWPFRPGDLVLVANTRKITNVVGKTVTVATVPGTWGTSTLFDVHSPESGAEIRCWDQTVSACAGTSITFTNNIDGTVTGTKPVAIGDYVCVQREAAIPALPRDMHPLIVRSVAMRLAEASGNAEKIKVAHDLLEEAKKNSRIMVQDRSGRGKSVIGCGGIIWKQAY